MCGGVGSFDRMIFQVPGFWSTDLSDYADSVRFFEYGRESAQGSQGVFL
jgi:hypothetical protein